MDLKGRGKKKKVQYYFFPLSHTLPNMPTKPIANILSYFGSVLPYSQDKNTADITAESSIS